MHKSLMNLFSLIFVFYASNMNSQIKKSLEEQLWDSVNPCYSIIMNESDGEIKDTDLFDGENSINDAKNGYLKISGSYPTCGCFCSDIAGAYKQSDGDYTILISEYWSCSTKRKTYSNRDIKKALPEDFGIYDFIPKYDDANYNLDTSVFYLDIDIPRVGTDTKVSLDFVPFGIKMKGNVITYSYSESKAELKAIRDLPGILKQLKEENVINYLLNKDFSKISDSDRDIIQEFIKPDDGMSFHTIEQMSEYMNYLKKVYEVYKLLEYKDIILGWDRNMNRFYIKEKIPYETEHLSFMEFLLNVRYWSGPSC